MIKVGILGLGGMGKTHLRCLEARRDVKVAAVCDCSFARQGSKASGEYGGILGYSDFDAMLEAEQLDAIVIAIPTFLHAEYAVKSLKAGLNVLCEKPMALNSAQCKKMVDAARRNGKILMVAHCIRFWPEYAKLKEIVDSGKYGRVIFASFRRLTSVAQGPNAAWLLDGTKSGGGALDFHIHESDYIQHLFGMPKAVFSRGVRGPSGDYDHIATDYMYMDKVVNAEGGWLMATGFGFEMSFNIICENASIVYDCTRPEPFKVYPDKAKPFAPRIEKGDGYSCQIDHFIKAVKSHTLPSMITPADAMNSVKIVEAEKKSAATGKVIPIKK
jgi:predicted dehydrogenase